MSEDSLEMDYISVLEHAHRYLAFAADNVKQMRLTPAQQKRARVLVAELEELRASILLLTTRWPTRGKAAAERLRKQLEEARELERQADREKQAFNAKHGDFWTQRARRENILQRTR